MRLIAALSTCLALAGCIVPVPIPVGVGVSQNAQAAPIMRLSASAPNSARFDRLLNDLRVQSGVGRVTSNAGLDRVAQRHAEAMRAGNYVAHRDAQGRKVTERVSTAGVSQCAAGENLAKGQGSVDAVFADWAASRGHRRNMLARGYANYGFGRAGDYWVLVLLQPC